MRPGRRPSRRARSRPPPRARGAARRPSRSARPLTATSRGSPSLPCRHGYSRHTMDVTTRQSGRLAGRVVVLSGAAGGIGRVYARRLAREGARLALIDVNGDGLRALVAGCRELAAEAMGIVADVSDPDAARRAVDETAERFGGIDALVNNAALFSTLPNRPFEEIPPDELDRVLAVNVRGPFLLCQAVLRHLRRRGGGKIVN